MLGDGPRLPAEVGARRGFPRRAGWQHLAEPLRSLVPEICNPLPATDPKAANAQERSGLGKVHLSVPVGTAETDRAAAEERAMTPIYLLPGRFPGPLMQTCRLHFPAKLTKSQATSGKDSGSLWHWYLLAPFFFLKSCDEGLPCWSSG